MEPSGFYRVSWNNTIKPVRIGIVKTNRQTGNGWLATVFIKVYSFNFQTNKNPDL
jgi:hypothetical protein